MRRESTTDILKCSTGQLRSLLALAIDRPGEYSSLLARARDVDEIERLLAGGQRLPGAPREGKEMVAALVARETSLTDLRGIRDSGKSLIARAQSDAEREAAAFIYHAASAAALGRYGINLSSVSPESRLPLYEDLATALGTHPLADVFREAVDYFASQDGL